LESVDGRAHVRFAVRRRELDPDAVGAARYDRKRDGHHVYPDRAHSVRERDRVASEDRDDRVLAGEYCEIGHQLAEQWVLAAR
jgi:hypothetical protein